MPARTTRPGLDDGIEALTAAFPFHLVVDAELRIVRLGPGLRRLDPTLPVGSALGAHFAIVTPEAPLDWQVIVEAPSQAFRLSHRASGLEIDGRWAVPAACDIAVFLGRTWLTDAVQLAVFGGLDTPSADATEASAWAAAAPADAPPAAPDAGGAAGEVDRPPLGDNPLALPIAVTRCLAQARSNLDALQLLTRELPRTLGWTAAALWTPNANGELAIAFGDRQAARAVTLAQTARTAGLPLRLPANAPECTQLALPAFDGDTLVGVITCVTAVPRPVGPHFADALSLASTQLSAFLAAQRDRARLLRLSSELSAIFQLCPDGFVAFDEQGRRSYVNPAFVQLTGISRTVLKDASEAELDARLAPLLDPARPPEPTPGGAQILHLLSPRPTVLLRSRRAARAPDGRLLGHVQYFRDITREAELVQHSNVFVSNAAHELRTPMASIQGFAELLARRELPPERQRQVLDTIREQSGRLVDIVNELLAVARFEARAGHEVALHAQPLAPVIRAAVAGLLVRNDPRAVDLTLPDGDGPWVHIDHDKLIQALTNVLSNAYKYSPDGGAITLSLRERQDDAGRWIGIAVCDHGIGMTPAEQSHLFERFYRARPNGRIPGTGLGLAMVKQIVDLHRGTVSVDSRHGEGTTVVLWLPCIADEAIIAQPESAPHHEPPRP